MRTSPRTSRNAIAVNAAANWTGFASQVVVAFFVTPILVHGLGDRRYGIWALVESIIAYLTLFDLGLAASLVRYVAKFEASEDQNGLNRVFSATVLAFTIAGVAALAIALALALPWARPLGVPVDLARDTRWLLVLLGGKLAVGLPMSAFSAVLDGLGRFAARTAVRTGGLLARTALMLAVLEAGGGLVELVAVVVAVTIAEDLALGVLVWRYLPALRLRLVLADRATFRLIGGYSIHAFLVMVAGRVSFQTDALVIGALLAPQYITFFAVAARLVEYSKSSLRAITTVLTPAVSELEARGDQRAIHRVLIDGTRYVLYLIMPVQVGLLILGRDFLKLWMGLEYVKHSFPTLAILSLPLAMTISQSISGRILYGIGRLGWFAWAAMLQALANLLLSVALAGPFGIEGVAWGTVIPNIIFNVALSMYISSVVGVSFADYLRRTLPRPLISAACLAATWWVATSGGRLISGWGSFIALGAIGVTAYAGLAISLEFRWSTILAAIPFVQRKAAGDSLMGSPEIELP